MTLIERLDAGIAEVDRSLKLCRSESVRDVLLCLRLDLMRQRAAAEYACAYHVEHVPFRREPRCRDCGAVG